MASRREYEMAFRLNAKLNSGFSSAISKARDDFVRLGKELQNLTKDQENIQSYQKQQKAIEATTSKIKELEKELENVRRSKDKAGQSDDQLNKQEAELVTRLNAANATLKSQAQALGNTGEKLRASGIDTRNLTSESARLSAEINRLDGEQQKAAKSVESFGKSGKDAFDAVSAAASGIVASKVFETLVDGFEECVQVAAQFQETMSTVQALSGATSEDMGSLSDKAKELGATTKFTANEAGQAMTYMAMAGWDTQQMLSGMDGVMNLAAASGEDLAQVSDIVTDNLTAFGMKAEDTAHFADVLAATATSSNTSVGIMGETFKNAAAVAGALGYSIEDVSVGVGLMANAGIKGSMAGTALKNTFNGLLEGVTLTSDAFGEYEFSATKADGTMKSFSATTQELRKYFNQMSESEKVANAQAIAGERAYNGLLAILNATDADYANLANSIDECSGAAARMANIKLDNLNGQLTLMNSAWDAVKTTIGEEFNPELQSASGLMTDFLSGTNTFLQKHPAIVKAVIAGAGAFAGLAGAVTTVSAAVKAFNALNLASLFTGPAGWALAAAGAIAGVTAAVVGLAAAADDGVPSVAELTEAASSMQDAISEADQAFNDTAISTQATADVAEMYIDKLDQLGEGTEASNTHSQEYLNTLALLCDAMPELTSLIDLQTGAVIGGTAALREHTDAWKQDAQEQAYQEYLNSLYDDYNTVLQESAENSIKLTAASTKREKAEQDLADAQARMNELMEQSQATGQPVADEYIELERACSEYAQTIETCRHEEDNLTKALAEDQAAVESADAAIQEGKEAYEQLTGAADDSADAQARVKEQTEQVNGVIDNATAEIQRLIEAYDAAYQSAYDSISGQYDLWDDVKEAEGVTVENTIANLEKQSQYWAEYNASLETLQARAADLEGLQELIGSFADGSPESVAMINDMATASDDDLQTMIDNWKLVQDEQEQTSESIADLKTNFSNEMDELQQNLAEDVENMDLSSEAAEAGRSTMDGYLSGISSRESAVLAKVNSMRQAVSSALNVATGKGFAVGTTYAPPGWAWVGENGPELMAMQGGERILNAARSQEVASAMSYSERSGGMVPSVGVNIQISGNASAETVSQLRGVGDEIVDRVTEAVMDRIADNQNDSMRRAYA